MWRPRPSGIRPKIDSTFPLASTRRISASARPSVGFPGEPGPRARVLIKVAKAKTAAAAKRQPRAGLLPGDPECPGVELEFAIHGAGPPAGPLGVAAHSAPAT